MSEPQKKPFQLPIKWSVPAKWTFPKKYTVPFPYTIPEDYSVPSTFEVPPIPFETTVIPKPEKKFEIDPLTAALITTGMVALFGGVMVGRISKRKGR